MCLFQVGNNKIQINKKKTQVVTMLDHIVKTQYV